MCGFVGGRGVYLCMGGYACARECMCGCVGANGQAGGLCMGVGRQRVCKPFGDIETYLGPFTGELSTPACVMQCVLPMLLCCCMCVLAGCLPLGSNTCQAAGECCSGGDCQGWSM